MNFFSLDGCGRRLGAILAVAFFSLGASNCGSIPIDESMSAERGNAATIILCDLDGTCHKGYAFAQLRNGSGLTRAFTFKAPELNCDEESCVRWQLWRLDGSQGASGAVDKKGGLVPLSVGAVVGSEDVLQPHHDGEYLFKAKFFWNDADGLPLSSIGWAFIRINVVDAQYQFMGCNDPASAFKTELTESCSAQYSTAFRSALCGVCG